MQKYKAVDTVRHAKKPAPVLKLSNGSRVELPPPNRGTANNAGTKWAKSVLAIENQYNDSAALIPLDDAVTRPRPKQRGRPKKQHNEGTVSHPPQQHIDNGNVGCYQYMRRPSKNLYKPILDDTLTLDPYKQWGRVLPKSAEAVPAPDPRTPEPLQKKPTENGYRIQIIFTEAICVFIHICLPLTPGKKYGWNRFYDNLYVIYK